MNICKFFCLIQSTVSHFRHLIVQQLKCSSIKFHNYNFVLNEVPNNNDITRVANIVLNDAPISNDATCVGNNVRLTAVGARQFSMVAIQPSCRKADIPETRDNDKITRKICADGKKLCPGKEWRLYTQQFRQQVDQCGQASSETKIFVIRKLQFSKF